MGNPHLDKMLREIEDFGITCNGVLDMLRQELFQDAYEIAYSVLDAERGKIFLDEVEGCFFQIAIIKSLGARYVLANLFSNHLLFYCHDSIGMRNFAKNNPLYCRREEGGLTRHCIKKVSHALNPEAQNGFNIFSGQYIENVVIDFGEFGASRKTFEDAMTYHYMMVQQLRLNPNHIFTG